MCSFDWQRRLPDVWTSAHCNIESLPEVPRYSPRAPPEPLDGMEAGASKEASKLGSLEARKLAEGFAVGQQSMLSPLPHSASATKPQPQPPRGAGLVWVA